MKNCDEMVESLLCRRTAYEKERKARRQAMLRVSTAACSLALVLLIGTGVNQGWWITQEPELPTIMPTQSVTDPTEPMAQAPTTASTQPTQPIQPTEPTVTEPAEQNTIIIHEIGDTSNDLMYIALMRDDFVPMTEAELVDYYGTAFVPEVPEDLADLRREPHLGIYRRDSGTGEVYHDEQRLTWTIDEVGSRGISVTVRKDRLPYQFFALPTEEFEPTVIREVEVGIGRTAEGIYVAEFLYKDVGFRIIADGVTQEELVEVIESLIG